MKKIPLRGKYGKGRFAVIDDEDFDLVNQYKWRVSYSGPRKLYVVTGKSPNLIRIHRLLTGVGKSKQVDHINHDTLDNRKINLRICTQSQNQHNSLVRKDSSSGYKGVSFHKGIKKWGARFQTKNTRKFLGWFETAKEAAQAYNKVANELDKEFALLNDL